MEIHILEVLLLLTYIILEVAALLKCTLLL